MRSQVSPDVPGAHPNVHQASVPRGGHAVLSTARTGPALCSLRALIRPHPEPAPSCERTDARAPNLNSRGQMSRHGEIPVSPKRDPRIHRSSQLHVPEPGYVRVLITPGSRVRMGGRRAGCHGWVTSAPLLPLSPIERPTRSRCGHGGPEPAWPSPKQTEVTTLAWPVPSSFCSPRCRPVFTAVRWVGTSHSAACHSLRWMLGAICICFGEVLYLRKVPYHFFHVLGERSHLPMCRLHNKMPFSRLSGRMAVYLVPTSRQKHCMSLSVTSAKQAGWIKLSCIADDKTEIPAI